jgi:ubiquinone/menaquinone biosynthesis C-methylase UbiE
MKLLPPSLLVPTGPVDHADWNYRPVLGWISRCRFHLVRALLGRRRYRRLLEIGYGSGVFLPELARHCQELQGIDVHGHDRAVADSLAQLGCRADLKSATAEAMPFPDRFFDCIVVVSALEFIADLAAACRQMRRVLRPEGVLVIVTPGQSPVVDWGLRILTGQSAREDFGTRRANVLPTLLQHFVVRGRRTLPPVGSSLVCLYTALKLGAPVEVP